MILYRPDNEKEFFKELTDLLIQNPNHMVTFNLPHNAGGRVFLPEVPGAWVLNGQIISPNTHGDGYAIKNRWQLFLMRPDLLSQGRYWKVEWHWKIAYAEGYSPNDYSLTLSSKMTFKIRDWGPEDEHLR